MMTRRTTFQHTARLFLPALAIAALASLCGCNMVQGLGHDISEVSKATESFLGGDPND